MAAGTVGSRILPNPSSRSARDCRNCVDASPRGCDRIRRLREWPCWLARASGRATPPIPGALYQMEGSDTRQSTSRRTRPACLRVGHPRPRCEGRARSPSSRSTAERERSPRLADRHMQLPSGTAFDRFSLYADCRIMPSGYRTGVAWQEVSHCTSPRALQPPPRPQRVRTSFTISTSLPTASRAK